MHYYKIRSIFDKLYLACIIYIQLGCLFVGKHYIFSDFQIEFKLEHCYR